MVREVLTISLRTGASKSCGCDRPVNRIPKPQRRIQIPVGTTFDRWTVIGAGVMRERNGRAVATYFPCRCACGTERLVWGWGLRAGVCRGCGCRKRGSVKPGLRKKRGEHARNQIYCRYVADAARKGREFALTRERFFELIRGRCHFCGVPPATLFTRRCCNGPIRFNGIDRLDSKKGYVEGNVVSCCKSCNRKKMNDSVRQFLAWARRIARHRGWIEG